ncbi:MAG: L-ribulose-5-phosphate 4-epimerase AraD [Gemmatimonadaceae bacterium]|nr:L-ribulose-5-phosphate 4-epimerase AraD [Gemmatimonadaceae bacterium]
MSPVKRAAAKSTRPPRASRALRDAVCEANIELFRRDLARFTFGNASGVDREHGLIVIKPSGVPYDKLTAAMLVATDFAGNVVEGDLRPSSDLPTHAALISAFPLVGGVVHTHSMFATVFSQAQREIPCLGTTHADYFYGPIPVTAPLTRAAIAGEYEWNTGSAIIQRFKRLDPSRMPAVLVAGHASFCWGASVQDAVNTASYLEEVATMAYHTLQLSPRAKPLPQALLDKHFLRKHGANAYYGQVK